MCMLYIFLVCMPQKIIEVALHSGRFGLHQNPCCFNASISFCLRPLLTSGCSLSVGVEVGSWAGFFAVVSCRCMYRLTHRREAFRCVALDSIFLGCSSFGSFCLFCLFWGCSFPFSRFPFGLWSWVLVDRPLLLPLLCPL
jgi:hypothetical protein